jgi:cytochrome b6-f complex iron-sulfur subunit
MMHDLTRRYFLQVIAASAATSAVLSGCYGGGGGSPESVGDVTAGNVSALQVGQIKSVSGSAVFVGRDANGVYAMTTTCTHQGCDLATGEISSTTITCPCHGSQYDLNGTVVRGPAPHSLTHYAVSIAADGTITVHGGSTVDASTRTAVSGA